MQQYTNGNSLVQGTTYQFRVEARNIIGFSNPSSPVSILCAQIPGIPSAPNTISSGSYVIVNWDAPDDGGTAITSYIIAI